MARIPETFLKQLQDRIDIVDLVREYVPELKRAGQNWHACCPFHAEKTPSFTVSQSKQFYHCFGCQAHGDVINFVCQINNMSFMDAVKSLAQTAGMEVPQEAAARPRDTRYELHLELLETASKFYQHQLTHSAQAEPARAYLNERGILPEALSDFCLGFAPDSWHATSEALLKKHPIANMEDLVAVGLCILHEKGHHYDRFRNRIIYPIRDSRGQTIGFGGRALGDDKPKYLNSPETAFFQKRASLYGLYESKKKAKVWRAAMVVEGYMDVIALMQASFSPVLATQGTAMTADHFLMLFKQTQSIYCCFDGDRAGRQAAWHALETVLPILEDGRQLHFMFLPEGQDPDSYIKKYGARAFRKEISQSYPLSEFFFESLKQRCPIRSIDDKARFAKLAQPYLKELPPGRFASMMRQELDDMMYSKKKFFQKKNDSTQRPTMPVPAELALALLHNNPALSGLIKHTQWLRSLGEASATTLADALDSLHHNETLLREVRLSENLAHLSEEGKKIEFLGALQRLANQGKRQLADRLLDKAQTQPGLTQDEKQQLNELLRSLAQQPAPKTGT